MSRNERGIQLSDKIEGPTNTMCKEDTNNYGMSGQQTSAK